MANMKLMPEVEALPADLLRGYILTHAQHIVQKTQGDSRDDPEELVGGGVELAHAVLRLFRDEFLDKAASR